MGISAQQMFDYVWDYFELDEEDLGQPLLERWAEEGMTRVYRHVKRWPHYESSEVITTTSGLAAYTSTLAQIHSVYGPDGPLDWKDHTEAQRFYDSLGVQASDARPLSWSEWGGSVYLWPKPDGEYDLTVHGHREPNAFVASGVGTEPDLPEDFHQAVLSWVMSRAYQHQDDFEGAQMETQEFTSMLALLAAHETQAPTSLPVTLGPSRRTRLGRSYSPSRLRYPWEAG